ncbi:MAG: glycine/sarcosine/betaine reductase selenoprotein B family protein [Chloroflexi bacterium]|nr:glycine/sarcosine/betaine reductase selenoprotein B family protein [Chloroflexota bacterium]
MPRLEDLTEVARQGHLNFPAFEHDDSPFAQLKKPLSESKLALVTTAGLQVRGDVSFTNNDQSFRVIPANTPLRDIVQSHTSIGFDRTAFMRDINVSFPVNRLNELVARGVVGSLSTNFYSFMEALRNPSKIVEETGPVVAKLLIEDGVDVVFLTPT